MKKLNLFLACCLAGSMGYAQTPLLDNTGISGGSTLVGGTNASDNLSLQSTTATTKGYVTVGSGPYTFFDETNLSVGVGRVPTNTLYTGDFYNYNNDTRGLFMTNDYAGNIASARVGPVSDVGTIQLIAYSSIYSGYGGSDLDIGNATQLVSNAPSFMSIVNTNTTPIIFAVGGHANSNEAMRIDGTTRYVGIGTTTPAYPLDVYASDTSLIAIHASGHVQANGFYVSSDRRFKKDMTKLESVNEKLSKLNGYTYNFKTEEFKDRNFPKDQQIGFIAQELKAVFPQLVSEDKQGYLAVNYQGMIPVLLEAAKEHQQQISTQQQQIDAQQKQIDELKKLVLANTLASSNSAASAVTSIAVNLSDADVVVLNQNQPNPFAEQTLITYNIPQNTRTAQLLFYDVNGRLINSVDVSGKGKGQLNVYASDLSNGTYSYTLIIDGKIMSTKKMVKQ